MPTAASIASQAGAPSVRLQQQIGAAKKAASRNRKRQLLYSIGVRVASLIVMLSLWQIVGSQISPVLFTTPTATLRAAITMISNGELLRYLLPSLVVLAYGLFFAVVLGVGFGLALARFRLLDDALDMYVTFLYSTPMVALVPLIVTWFGFDTTAKVIMVFVFAFFPMIINTYQGVKNVDPDLIDVGRSFRCSEPQMWRHIILPGALPFIVTGLRLAVGRGLIGMVFADLYTAISGIGYLIVRTQMTYQIDRMFVPIMTLGFLGLSLTYILRIMERSVAPWTKARERTT